MSATPYAGPAFPVLFEHSDGQAISEHFGMDLRDYLATAALPPVMYICRSDDLEGAETRADLFARKAYEMADAMLKARAA